MFFSRLCTIFEQSIFYMTPRAARRENFPSRTQMSYLIAINACILRPDMSYLVAINAWGLEKKNKDKCLNASRQTRTRQLVRPLGLLVGAGFTPSSSSTSGGATGHTTHAIDLHTLVWASGLTQGEGMEHPIVPSVFKYLRYRGSGLPKVKVQSTRAYLRCSHTLGKGVETLWLAIPKVEMV